MGLLPVASLRPLQILWPFDLEHSCGIYFGTLEDRTINFLYRLVFLIALTFGGTVSETEYCTIVISWIFFFFFWLAELVGGDFVRFAPLCDAKVYGK